VSYIEVSDPSSVKHALQRTYVDYRLKHVLDSGPLIFVLPAVFNLMMLFADFANMHSQTSWIIILSVRLIFTGLLFVLMFNSKKIRSFHAYSIIITLSEALYIGIFLCVFFLYSNPDYYIQTFGIITIILAVFLIPNRWTNMIILVGASGIAFLISAKIIMPGIDTMVYLAGAVYIAIDSALCAFFAWNRQKAQRHEYEVRQKLSKLSSTDHLTQAMTRSKLEEEAERWMVFCRRQGLPLSLAFVDVDDLKTINDRDGHLVGDNVLTEIVIRMRSILRKSDIVSRWGGDEFIMLLPDSGLAKTVEISETIRQLIEKEPFASNISVTCSFGVVSMDTQLTFKTMIRSADELMYASKKLGKNRVEQI